MCVCGWGPIRRVSFCHSSQLLVIWDHGRRIWFQAVRMYGFLASGRAETSVVLLLRLSSLNRLTLALGLWANIRVKMTYHAVSTKMSAVNTICSHSYCFIICIAEGPRSPS